ncbi:alpha/beta hydrolase [Nocardia sp. MW-W600-9]
MNDVTARERAPRGVRLLHALQREPDWPSLTPEELVVVRDAANRRAAARFARVITGFPDRGAAIDWREVTLPDRVLPVRVYRPVRGDAAPLPLIVHIHGGGFVGTAPQCDWANSHLAARLPAVVVSVEHRLLAPGTPLSAAVEDGWEVLRWLVAHAEDWGIDPGRVAVAGESTGGLIAAMAAIRAAATELPLRAQILAEPRASGPVPPAGRGADARAVSPLYADLSGLAPALVLVPTVDPVADQGRRYAERPRESGTPVRLTEHPGAPHAFITLPGLVPQAKTARAQTVEFLTDRLVARRSPRRRR